MPSPNLVVGRSSEKDVGLPSSQEHSKTILARDSGFGNNGNHYNQGISPGKDESGSGTPNQRSSCAESIQFSTENHTILDDNDAAVVYFGDWNLITGNTNGNLTQHMTSNSNAYVYAPFSGTSITVVGTVPNGTDPIVANYSIDGGTAQTRIVPTSSQCAIPKDPFFSATGLKAGTHYINITMTQVGSRPYMLNFFALDPSSLNYQQATKPNVGQIAGGVAAGVVLCILVCIFVVAFRRRLAWLKRARSSNSGDEKQDGVDTVSICSTCKCLRVDPFEVGPAPDTFKHGDEHDTASSSESLIGDRVQRMATPEPPVEEVQSQASPSRSIGILNDPDRVSMTTRATRGSRESMGAPAMPPLNFRRSRLDAGASKIQRNGGNDEGEDDGDTGESRWSRRASSASSKTLVLD